MCWLTSKVVYWLLTGTFSDNVNMNGSFVRASSAFSTVGSNQYDLTTAGYVKARYGNDWQVITTGYTAVAGDRIMCNTSGGGFTVTLPSAPNRGDSVHFIDYSRTFNTQNLTVNNNGNRIMGILDTMTVSTAGAAFQLVYSGASNPGWLMAQGI